jgi:hypothetical protein
VVTGDGLELLELLLDEPLLDEPLLDEPLLVEPLLVLGVDVWVATCCTDGDEDDDDVDSAGSLPSTSCT